MINNPLRLIDPDGKDWYESESGGVLWRKGNAEKIKSNGEECRNIGKEYSARMEDGKYVNCFQNYVISIGKKESALDRLSDSPILMSAFLKNKSVSKEDKSTILKSAIHKGQMDFLRGFAELTASELNTAGTGMEIAGLYLTMHGAGELGIPLMGLGRSTSLIGTSIDAGLDLADGDYIGAGINMMSWASVMSIIV